VIATALAIVVSLSRIRNTHHQPQKEA